MSEPLLCMSSSEVRWVLTRPPNFSCLEENKLHCVISILGSIIFGGAFWWQKTVECPLLPDTAHTLPHNFEECSENFFCVQTDI